MSLLRKLNAKAKTEINTGFGTNAADIPLKEMIIDRREVTAKDIEIEQLTKLYSMSLKSQLFSARISAIENLKNDEANLNQFQAQLSELKNSEKNEKVLELLNTI